MKTYVQSKGSNTHMAVNVTIYEQWWWRVRMLDICRPSNIYISVHSLSPFDKSESKFNRPFYQYDGHIKFIRLKEYYGMPSGHLLSIYVCLGKKSFIV